VKCGHETSTISAPSLDEQGDGLVEALRAPGAVASPAELLDDADAQARDVADRAAATTSARGVDRRGVRGSWPPMTSCSSAVSSTVRAHGPAWSSEEAIATRP
jgi:hypothetical protein